ncbi:MAG: helix-turn-helix transcriptional regulator [Ruminococcus sp.]|nr:helix-turn-helix transcriptional regulator [Ruminococcus sp.]
MCDEKTNDKGVASDKRDALKKDIFYWRLNIMNRTPHSSYDKEVAFYESVRTGNYEMAKMLSTPLCSEGYGILSKDSLRNIKYHLVVSVAMITRFCIEGGMPSEDAYGLSDSFINKADVAESVDEVHKIHAQMIETYCNAMYEIRLRGVYSLQIVKAIDYIKGHVNDKVGINEIAEYLGISVPYLSRLFKAETGENVSEYIIKRKIEAAIIMLKYSSKSIAEISAHLNFSSQSYFTKVFRKYAGLTPKEYKNGNFFISPKEILEEIYINNDNSIDEDEQD